ncbi:MAG: bifunctional phosphoribosylaminoimidazolecarboxamide formyltransferase/IMP cyclohydrolase [Candidatus Micrarchaeia archaeon]
MVFSMVKIQRALISVFDKGEIVSFAKELINLKIEIISSGGTAKLLKENNIPVTEVSKLTRFPEMMDGRIKTLHPKIHGAILADRSKKSHMEEAKKNKIEPIDLVVVNLYPFEKVVSKKDVNLEDAIENIDIGGPTLIRSGAKNYKSVAVVCNPLKYEKVVNEIKEKGELSLKTREALALEAFEHISRYDIIIEKFLRKTFNGEKYPKYLNLAFEKIQDLRYGENPHQSASYYLDIQNDDPCMPISNKLQGKELSYNNILDMDGAFECVKNFKEPTCVIVKHNNPCGVASTEDILTAYKRALEVDEKAAFGGIVAVNRKIEEDFAKEIVARFYEVIIAPGYSKEAREILSAKKNLRLIQMGNVNFPFQSKPYLLYRSVKGGLLVQDANTLLYDENQFKVVTKIKPNEKQMKDLLYAWTVCKYVKSNSVIYAKDNKAVGIGAGQMKRVDAAKLASMITQDYGESVKGCSMASDAFLPFRDAVDEAAARGIVAIIQPGGSIRDKEVISAADEYGIAMVFTGMRHFRH